jgi:hypothetical protein
LAHRNFAAVNSPKKPILLSLLVLFGALLGGCALQSPQDSSIPWAKPADWEGQIPGMAAGGH